MNKGNISSAPGVVRIRQHAVLDKAASAGSGMRSVVTDDRARMRPPTEASASDTYDGGQRRPSVRTMQNSAISVAPREPLEVRAQTLAAGAVTSCARSVFHEPWWLDIATDGNWQMAKVARGGEIVGELPYWLRRRGIFRLSDMPPLTRTLGPALKPVDGDPHKTLIHRLEITSELIEQLPALDSFYQICDPRTVDGLAFGLSGYTITTRYTFQFDGDGNIDEIWKGLRGKTRNLIRTAQKCFRVKPIETPDEFGRFYESNLTRRGRSNVYGTDVMQRLVTAFVERQSGYLLGAYAPDGQLVAAIAIACDRLSAYFLLSSRLPDSHSGSISLLVWAAIEDAMRCGLTFDFDGIPSPATFRFLTGFNASLRQRLAVERSTVVCSVARAFRRTMLAQRRGPFMPTI